MKMKPLTKKEEEIMRVFWEQSRPLGLDCSQNTI